MTKRLLLALFVGVSLWVATHALRPWWFAHRQVAVQIEGQFTREGQYPGQPLGIAPTPRTWGSWSGADANEGKLKLGPFPAPSQLRLALSGYPHGPGNDLYLEMPWLGITLPLESGNIGERWETKTYDIPYGWQGRLVNIVAVDRSHDIGGWLAVSEPLPLPSGPRIESGFGADLAAWLVNGLLLSLGFVTAARWLRGREWLPSEWVAVAAGGLVTLAGYLAFWVYLLHPLAGRIYSLSMLGAVVLAWARAAPQGPDENDEWRAVARLAAAIGLLYLALLHLFPVWRDFYDVAENRFVAALPGDNRLPHDIGTLLFEGKSPKNFTVDWLSSDRPPLQIGWQLLTWPVTAWLGFGATTASGTSAVWLQLLWVAGAYGLLRTFGLARPRAFLLTALLAFSGFFLQNTVFTWPKLCSAAFTCAAVALWLQPPHYARFVAGAVLAALAWLSHGGVAFSFLAFTPWAAWRAWRGDWRAWTVAAVAFLVLALPWVAYQKFYDPPGNRLLKWHLAGQIEIDPRGLVESIRDGYQKLSWRETVDIKLGNFRTQFSGDWTTFAQVSPAGAEMRRSDEFSYTVRALMWWLVGFGALAALLAHQSGRQRLLPTSHVHVTFTWWTAATLVIWCLMMFGRDPAVIILGSYAPMLALFALLAAWCSLAGGWVVAGIALLQGISFVTTWAVSNQAIAGSLDRRTLFVALAGAGAMLALVWREHFGAEREKAGQPRD